MATTQVPGAAEPVGRPGAGDATGDAAGAPAAGTPGAARARTLPAWVPVAAWWALSRGATLALLLVPFLYEHTALGDVHYYARSLDGLLHHGAGLDHTFREYPLPVFAVLLPQYLIGGLNASAYLIVFPASMMLLDAVYTAVLWRSGGRSRRPGAALVFWLLFVPALGPICWFRFDLVPGALCGLALLAIGRHPRAGGAALGAGAAIKLWPALGLPVLALPKADRRRVLTGFVATGAGLGVLTIVLAGWHRAISPLTWQSDRGLQIESVVTTPLMLLRAVDPRNWHLRYSRFQAEEIYGPGVSSLLTLSTVLTVLAVVVLVWLWWRTQRRQSAPAVHAWLLVTAALVVVITDKTLSPQYLLWVAGPAAALLAWSGADVVARRAAALLLVIAVLTQTEYPVLYTSLVQRAGVAPTIVLAVRNALLVALFVVCAYRVWHDTRRHAGGPRTVPRSSVTTPSGRPGAG